MPPEDRNNEGRAATSARRWRRLVEWVLSLERLTAWVGDLVTAVFVVMTAIITFEVISRYVFGSPTIWAWDVNVQLFVLLTMFGVAEAYRRDAHVRVDVITTLLSERPRAMLDVAFAAVLLLVGSFIVWYGWDYFTTALREGQRASTLLEPPIYPVKFVIPAGGALLMLQAVLKLIRDIQVVVATRNR